MQLIHRVPSGRGFREHVPLVLYSKAFQARFGTLELCHDYLFHKRWPNGFVCAKCDSRELSWIGDKPRFRCIRCRRQYSLTANTILHGTRKPLTQWFRAAFLMAQKGGNATVLEEQLGLTYKVAWTWARKIREAMSSKTTLDSPFPSFEESSDARLGPRTPLTEAIWALRNGQFRWFGARPGGAGSCCGVLTKEDWDDPERDGPDEDERWRYTLESNGVLVAFAKWWLFRAYSGSIGDKHLRAYLDDMEFRINRRRFDAVDNAGELAGLLVATPRRTYRDFVGQPADRSALRLWGPPVSRRLSHPA